MDDPMEWLTPALAVWGAVLSTIALGWNIFRSVSDRGRLSVSCYVGNIVRGSGPKDEKDYLVWSVVNVGSRPLFLKQIGGKSGDKNFMIIPAQQLPKMLQPGESFVDHSLDFAAIKSDLKALGAWDSHGRFYPVPRKDLRNILAKDLAPPTE